MSAPKKPKALVDAEKKIEELEKKLREATNGKDMYWKMYTEEKAISDGIHDILDDLGIRRKREGNQYNDLPLSVRLFAWAMSIHSKTKE